jgi:threonine dehydratase
MFKDRSRPIAPDEVSKLSTEKEALEAQSHDSLFISGLDAARKNASLSGSFVEFMRDHEIRLQFSSLSEEGPWAADATCNPTNAYKVRGALVSAELARQEGQTTLVTASAGNHGAGLAYAAQQLGMRAVIYVPRNAPQVKVDTIRSFGAEVRLVGDSFDTCLLEARKDALVVKEEAKFVHPFDDSAVVAGQGTIGFELLEHLEKQVLTRRPEKVRVVLPIGGGGLAAGVLSVLKTRWPREFPPLEVVGVVDESSPASLLAMLRGRPVRALTDTIADGTKVEMVGGNFLAVAHLLDGLVLLPHDELVDAMRWYEQRTGVRLEGAGALALGGEEVISRYNLLNDPASVVKVALISGKNIDPDRFQDEVTADARMNAKEKRRQGFDVVIPERPGQLLRFLEVVKDYNIASLTYVRQVGSKTGHLRVEFEVAHDRRHALKEVITSVFLGSKKLVAGHQILHVGVGLGTEAGTEKLIRLDDAPGSFLRCIRELTEREALGQVDFLFYRKPAKRGSHAQVVMGQASPALEVPVPEGEVRRPRFH